MYELEILRLLHLFAPDNHDVRVMIGATLKRLKTTCFGFEDDSVGECFDASLVVLRFVSTVATDKADWIKSRISNYNNHVNEKKRPWFSLWYYWLCLSEMPFEIAKIEVEKYKGEILNWLCNKSCVMNSEQDKTIHPVIISMLRNIIARYPEYEYIKYREPYISEKDGRQYCSNNGYTHDLAWALIGLEECADWTKHAAYYFGEMVELTLDRIKKNDIEILDAVNKMIEILNNLRVEK